MCTKCLVNHNYYNNHRTVIHYQQLLKVQRRWTRQINNENRTTNNNTVLLIVVIFQRDWSKSVVYSRRFFNNKMYLPIMLNREVENNFLLCHTKDHY